MIQNQIIHFSNKRRKIEVEVELKNVNQYVAKVDSSGRSSVQNRSFLKRLTFLVAKL